MRKVILGLLLFGLSVAQGQIFSNPIKIVAADPSGSCAPRTIALSVATGSAFYCASNNSMWVQFTVGAGGGTVINDVTLTSTQILLGNGTTHTTASSSFTATPATGSWKLNKFNCSGTPVTCTLYDDTATTGSTGFIVRAGAAQSSGGVMIEFTNPSNSVMGGIDSFGAFYVQAVNDTNKKKIALSANTGTNGNSISFSSDSILAGFSGTDLNGAGSYDVGLIRGAAGQWNVNDGSTTATNLRDLLARTLSSGDGTVAGEDKLLELTANGNNFRSWLAPDLLTTDLRLKFPDTLPSADGIMLFPAPTASVSQFVWTSFPSCPDTGGQHLNFSSPTLSCGTSGGGTSSMFTTSGTGNYWPFGTSTQGSGTGGLPAANAVVCHEFAMPAGATVNKIFLFPLSGAADTGHWAFGIYDASGSVIQQGAVTGTGTGSGKGVTLGGTWTAAAGTYNACWSSDSTSTNFLSPVGGPGPGIALLSLSAFADVGAETNNREFRCTNTSSTVANVTTLPATCGTRGTTGLGSVFHPIFALLP